MSSKTGIVMNIKTFFFKNLIFVFILLSCMACGKDAHNFFYFINHSDAPVWIHITSESRGTEHFKPSPIGYEIKAHDTLQVVPRNDVTWEDILYKDMNVVVSIYDRALSTKPNSESNEEFSQQHLLEENWYTLDDMNAMNWEVHYYPDAEKADND